MGKHDKTVFKWDVPKDAFDIAENQKLRAENEKLKERIAEIEKSLEKSERFGSVMEKLTDPVNGSFVPRVEYEDIMEKYEQLEAEYEEQAMYILDIKAALVRATLREAE